VDVVDIITAFDSAVMAGRIIWASASTDLG